MFTAAPLGTTTINWAFPAFFAWYRIVLNPSSFRAISAVMTFMSVVLIVARRTQPLSDLVRIISPSVPAMTVVPSYKKAPASSELISKYSPAVSIPYAFTGAIAITAVSSNAAKHFPFFIIKSLLNRHENKRYTHYSVIIIPRFRSY